MFKVMRGTSRPSVKDPQTTQSCVGTEHAMTSHLSFPNIEEASAARALPTQPAHLAPREPHVASNQQNGRCQPQQLLQHRYAIQLRCSV